MQKVLLALSLVFVSLFFIPLFVLRGYSETPGLTSGSEQTVRVLIKTSGKIVNMPLEEYLIGVVAAEMPADFTLEALKAQAIAARTYTVKRMFNYGAKPSAEHPSAEVCTDPVHCQAWDSDDTLREKWGRIKYTVNINKIRTVVRATQGQVITYGGIMIDPVYHGSCGGKGTENSEDVWPGEVPYLRSVDCLNEYGGSDQICTIEVNKPELLSRLKNAGLGSVPAVAGKEPLLFPVKKSARGRLQEVKVFGQKITGTGLRQALGLTSTFLTWEIVDGKLRFSSFGKGHAVGLCQRGANGMAVAGSNYRTIISHYYTGVKIQKLRD